MEDELIKILENDFSKNGEIQLTNKMLLDILVLVKNNNNLRIIKQFQ